MNTEHLITPDPTLPAFAGGSVIRRSDAIRLADSRVILETARADAEASALRASEEFERRRMEGFNKGLEEGLLEARRRNLEAVAATTQYFHGLHEQVCDMVVSCLRNIIVDLPPLERIRQVAMKALENTGPQEGLVLYLSPEDMPRASKMLAQLQASLPDGIRIEPRTRSDITPGECLLETPLGVVRSGIEDQLEMLRTTLLKSQT